MIPSASEEISITTTDKKSPSIIDDETYLEDKLITKNINPRKLDKLLKDSYLDTVNVMSPKSLQFMKFTNMMTRFSLLPFSSFGFKS